MEELKGGRKEQVFLHNAKVYRPRGKASEAIHRLLKHLKLQDFLAAPEPFGFDEQGQEILSFVAGAVHNHVMEPAINSEHTLRSAADLLRRYHQASKSFLAESESLSWLLPSRAPQEVICHGDFAPYNMAFSGDEAVGLFDFDTAHPGPKIWDVAYAIYRWAPFRCPELYSAEILTEQTKRAKIFCDVYGLTGNERQQLVDTMVTRLQILVSYMQTEADKGNVAFIENITDGHQLEYLTDCRYLVEHRTQITQGIEGHLSIKPE